MWQQCCFSYVVWWLPPNQPSHPSITYKNSGRKRAGEVPSSACRTTAQNLHTWALFRSHTSPWCCSCQKKSSAWRRIRASRGQHSLPQATAGRLWGRRKGGRPGATRGELALRQEHSSLPALCPPWPSRLHREFSVGSSVPQQGVSGEIIHVKSLWTQSVKHLDCENMTYMKTGARSGSLLVEDLVVIFFLCYALKKLWQSSKCCTQLSFCGPYLRDPLTEGQRLSTKHTCCSKSVFGLNGARPFGVLEQSAYEKHMCVGQTVSTERAVSSDPRINLSSLRSKA